VKERREGQNKEEDKEEVNIEGAILLQSRVKQLFLSHITKIVDLITFRQ
jgi:hypothetical protein